MKYRIVYLFKAYTARPQDWQVEYCTLKNGTILEAFRYLYNRYGDDVEGVLSIGLATSKAE